MKEKILIVDDEEMLLELLQTILSPEGYELETFSSPIKAFDRIWENGQKPDLIITDLDLGKGYTGLGFIRSARERWGKNIPVAIMSGGFKAASEAECLRETPNILLKPFKTEEAIEFVKNLLDASKLQTAS
jgi:DNA-binding response OmpR family regulator